MARAVRLYKLSDESFPASNLQPRFNFAPTQTGVVVRLDKQRRRVAEMMRWGLVPYWSKDDKGGAKMINAKAETVAEKPAYRKAFQSRPCLVPADGFFEWSKLPGGEKQPYFFTTQFQEPFAFAALLERWHAPDAALDARPLETFTILTTEPNALCAPIHDRMPGRLVGLAGHARTAEGPRTTTIPGRAHGVLADWQGGGERQE